MNFWHVITSNPVGGFQCFSRTYCLHLQGKSRFLRKFGTCL